MTLTVGDLFCGAGGFSEGFRQAGFSIKWAVDNWPPAVNTFARSFAETRTLRRDILRLQARELDQVDVVIGSPPCTQFSLANKGGKGDKDLGFQYVKRFLRIVRDLQPKYWIMENVPHLSASLEEAMDGDVISLRGGELEIPVRAVLLAADYGTPQLRRRLFSGNYPLPGPTHGEERRDWITLGRVVRGLPDSCKGPPRGKMTVRDPLYPGVRTPASRLRDHFEDGRTRISGKEASQCRRHKGEHRVYGPMEFPDSLGRPSRTITAVRTKQSRSTIAIDCPHHRKEVLRTLTVRETASVQGFPVLSQFWANSFGKKETLIGNSVPPPVARALANAILEEEGSPILARPRIHRTREMPELLVPPEKRLYKPSLMRRFRGYVRVDWSPDCRVELDNSGENPGLHPLMKKPHLKKWVTRLYLGYAKEYRCYEIGLPQALQILQMTLDDGEAIQSLASPMKDLLSRARKGFSKSLPDATTLQANWAHRTNGGTSPQTLLSRVQELVEEVLPAREWKDFEIPRQHYSGVLGNLFIEGGTNATPDPPKDLTARTLGVILVLSLACELVNSGSSWMKSESAAPYVPEGWKSASTNRYWKGASHRS